MPINEISPFAIIPLLVVLVFAFVFVSIVVAMLRGFAEWVSNNRQPVRSEMARVVAKRTEVRGHGHVNRRGHTWTSYYCTFEVGDGTRYEFNVSGEEYGQIAEGDTGTLTFQGTRYRGFRRRVDGRKYPLESQADF